jgi:signal transduction histidine kinase
MVFNLFNRAAFILILTSIGNTLYGQLTEAQQLKHYYDKGISSADRSLDSMLYYAEYINRFPSKGPLKQFYYHSLKFSYFYKAGQIADTKKAAFESLTWANETNDIALISDAYVNIAIYYLDINEQDSTAYYSELALNKALLLNDETRVHRILTNYANSLIELGQKEEALEYAHNAITYDSLYGNNLNRAHNYHLLGNVYTYSGDYPEALDAYLISLAAYEKEKNVIDQINVLNNVGLVYNGIGNYEKAEKTYLKSLDLIEKNNLEKEKISALVNLGSVYTNLGKPEKNKELLLEALALCEKYNNPEFEGQIQNNLGNVAYYEGNYAQALVGFKAGLEIAISVKNKHEQALCHSNIGWANLMLGNEKECFEAFEKAYALAIEIKSNEKRMMALEGLADASEHFGNYKEALVYKNQFFALKDSVLGEKAQTKIAELEALYENEKKENEIQDLKQKEELSTLQIRENDLLISRLNWQRIGLTLLIFMLLLIAFFSWRFYHTKKEREKNQALLAERERGLQAVFDATEEERKRISRELHDGIGQQMSGLKLAWQNLSISAKGLTDTEKQKLKELSEILDSTATEVRTLSHQMMPKVLESFGLVPAMDEMLEKALQLTALKYQFEHYNLDQRLPQRVELAVFRIAQELINNVIKHAKASFVSVQLFKNQQQLILIIEDNGTGIAKNETGDGHGLLNIRSRLNTINGQINFETSVSAGTAATVRISI